MAKSAAPAGIFTQKPSGSESKQQTTNSAARAILAAEVRARDAKTVRLRELRLQREADAPVDVPAAPKPKKARAVKSAK